MATMGGGALALGHDRRFHHHDRPLLGVVRIGSMANRKQNKIISRCGNTEVRITKDKIIFSVKKPGQEISDPTKDRLEQWLDGEGDFRFRMENAVDTIRLLCKFSLSLLALNTVLLLLYLMI